MSNSPNTYIWLMRACFAFICIAVMFWQLMPLETLPRRWAGPDLLLVLCLLWVQRRPDYAPALLVASIMLLADFIYQRPPGLYAAIILIVSENLRRRARMSRDMSITAEWLTAAGAMAVIVLANRFFMALFVLDQGSLALTFSQLLMSVLVYPVAAAAMVVLFGLRHISPSEREGFGGRA